jgi:hypothetical protein
MKLCNRSLILAALLGCSLLSCTSYRNFIQSNKAEAPDFIADMDPIPIGGISLQFNKLFSSAIEKKDADVVYDPRQDAVYVQFRYQMISFRQYWNRPNREKVLAALEQYTAAYEEKNLPLKGNRAKRAFGVVIGMVEWGQTAFAGVLMNSRGSPYLELGYQFKQNSPYFTVVMRSAENEKNATSSENKSLEITSYYTRAQGKELAALFDQEYLLGFLNPRAVPGGLSPDVDTGYVEADTDSL